MKNRNLEHRDDWKTPPAFYEEKNKIHNFDFDPCPFEHDIELWDGLEIEWGERNYINPPYLQALKEAFVIKAIEESKKNKLCVMLLPVSTSTDLFHNYILPYKAGEIEFLKRRLQFIGINSKGQMVNYHLLGEVTEETINYIDDKGNEKILPLHVKNSGMHDSMVITFDGRAVKSIWDMFRK